ncbi:unnamed protein product, partial [Cyprideis torosa]
MVFVAGQVPIGGADKAGEAYKGKAGADIDMETAQAAATQCGLNILRQIGDAVEGDWNCVKRCVKLGGFVNCTPDYTDMSLVINAASDLMVAALVALFAALGYAFSNTSRTSTSFLTEEETSAYANQIIAYGNE